MVNADSDDTDNLENSSELLDDTGAALDAFAKQCYIIATIADTPWEISVPMLTESIRSIVDNNIEDALSIRYKSVKKGNKSPSFQLVVEALSMISAGSIGHGPGTQSRKSA